MLLVWGPHFEKHFWMNLGLYPSNNKEPLKAFELVIIIIIIMNELICKVSIYQKSAAWLESMEMEAEAEGVGRWEQDQHLGCAWAALTILETAIPSRLGTPSPVFVSCEQNNQDSRLLPRITLVLKVCWY